MELTEDLVIVIDILRNVMKTTGEFTRINHKGGNEDKISKITEVMQKHIKSKNTGVDGKINSAVDKELDDIVFFLALNTEYRTTLNLSDAIHLTNIMPKLSKCIFANVVYNLDLCKYYCKVVEKFPIKCSIELLEEIIVCLRRSHKEVQLRYAIMLFRAAANKLSSADVSEEDDDDIFRFSEVVNIILQLLTGVSANDVQNRVRIYQHMGYTILSLLELLLYCDKENTNLDKFIENVIRTCCNILESVTVDVFCSWAEIKEDEEPLQTVVAGKAYEVVEEYRTYKGAETLVGMLRTIAKKPRTLSERIQAADVATMIQKASIPNQEQRAWFKSLVGTQVFDNKAIMKCIDTWPRVCDKDDVMRLLELSRAKSGQVSPLAVKCASTLTLEDLLLIMTRYFYKHGFDGSVSDIERIEFNLKLIFNKMNGQTTVDEDLVKNLCLLLLQSPGLVLKGIYGECIKDKCYVECYKGFFVTVKEIANIKSFGVVSLWEAAILNQPSPNNLDNYVALLSTLQEMDYLSKSKMINELLLPLLDLPQPVDQYERLGYVLQIFLIGSIAIPANSELTNFRWTLVKIIDECRCTFLELSFPKQQAVSYAVDIVMNLCAVNPGYDFENEPHRTPVISRDRFTNYYIKYLSSKTNFTLFRTLYSDFSIDDYAACVNRLLKFMPRAVTNEWLSITQELFSLRDNAAELLTDVIMLLSKVTQTQLGKSTHGQFIGALKYCLQQYGNALLNIQSDSTEAVEVNITRHACRLLKHLPETVQDQEGLSIINLLTQRSLQLLADDREFACLLLSIENGFIRKMLAKRTAN